MWATLIALAIDNFFIFMYQVGQILMKLTYQGYYERGNDPSARRVCLNKFMWFVGFSCCGCSQMIHVFCAPYLDIILMSTLTMTAIVTGVILSIFWLKEPFNAKYDVPAISLMVVGSVCLVLVSNKEKSDYTAD